MKLQVAGEVSFQQTTFDVRSVIDEHEACESTFPERLKWEKFGIQTSDGRGQEFTS